MFFRHLDLTPALRPALFNDETLLFVQDGIGLYHGQDKLKEYDSGHAYLTTHRVCYVDNNEPRRYSVALDLKDVDRIDFYAGFLKSSAKITFYPKQSQSARSPPPFRSYSTNQSSTPASPTRSTSVAAFSREIQATWICPICGFPNNLPQGFDPATANQHTQIQPCQACGIKPPLLHLVKAAISAISNRSATTTTTSSSRVSTEPGNDSIDLTSLSSTRSSGIVCPRCTFENDASMVECEICHASLSPASPRQSLVKQDNIRADSPGPSLSALPMNEETVESVKLAFRAGGEKIFLERLRNAILQRKWLLSKAPPVPSPNGADKTKNNTSRSHTVGSHSSPRIVGIAGLEQRGALARQKNQAVIGTAFEDLEALMTSAKEVIAMAEEFRAQSAAGNNGMSSEAKALIDDSASALGLITTKDMLGSGSSSEMLYITELSRDVAEFLTDDRRGVLRKEGGIISLVDLWAVFNRTRNGIELVSPLDFEKAAVMWEKLNMPIRLRRFRSGSLVVQERGRTDEKTVAAIINWLKQPLHTLELSDGMISTMFGKGVTAQETAENFHWSIGVATEELEMAEELGALCRDQCIDGVRFWQNHLSGFQTNNDELGMVNRLSLV